MGIASSKRIVVAADHRHLERGDGTPFLYLGDTAWELFHRLSLEEADVYLRDRASKGFTVIQAVVLAELDGLTVANANGDLPLEDLDPARPTDAYFAHVDAIVRRANELGLVVGMLPTWGRYWKQADVSLTGPGAGSDHSIFTAKNARGFGEYLGARYQDADLIWILGGDYDLNTAGEREIVNAMAAGLATGDGGAHLRTFHPRGPGRSREQLDGSDWVDFHMNQSSHADPSHDPGIFIDADYAMEPPMPVVDGEPRYEQIPVGFYWKGNNPAVRFTDHDARTAAWQSILAGACGHTYGNNNIWQMWDEGRSPVLSATVPWHVAIHHPGAAQMGYLRTLLEEVDWWKLHPATDAERASFLLDGPAHGAARVRAALAEDGSAALVYSAQGAPFTLRLSALAGPRVRARWFDPRYGVSFDLHTGAARAMQTYTPPSSGDECDWVLVLQSS